MLMTFSKEQYMERINAGIKIHTIRTDEHKRWRVGMKAHMWMHSPRTPKKNPFQFGESIVSEIKDIEIHKRDSIGSTHWTVEIDGIALHSAQVEALAKADGGWRGGIDALDEDWIVTGVQCPWCCAFWLAAPAAVLWGRMAGAPLALTLAAWPAMASVTCVLYRSA